MVLDNINLDNDKFKLIRPRLFTTLYELEFKSDLMDGTNGVKPIVHTSRVSVDVGMGDRITYSNVEAVNNTANIPLFDQTFKNRVIVGSLLNCPISRLSIDGSGPLLDVEMAVYCDGKFSEIVKTRRVSLVGLDRSQKAFIKDIINIPAIIWVANDITIHLIDEDDPEYNLSINQSKDFALFDISTNRRCIYERIENNVIRLELKADKYGYRLIRDYSINYSLDISLPKSRFQDIAKMILKKRT